MPPAWGAAGLTASAGVAGWVEMLLLRSTLNARIGPTGLSAVYVVQLWTSALAAAAVAWAIKLIFFPPSPILVATMVLIPYGLTFFAVTAALRVPEASEVLQRARRFL
jgi:putative peptidoglycan lipid II flippase